MDEGRGKSLSGSAGLRVSVAENDNRLERKGLFKPSLHLTARDVC